MFYWHKGVSSFPMCHIYNRTWSDIGTKEIPFVYSTFRRKASLYARTMLIQGPMQGLLIISLYYLGPEMMVAFWSQNYTSMVFEVQRRIYLDWIDDVRPFPKLNLTFNLEAMQMLPQCTRLETDYVSWVKCCYFIPFRKSSFRPTLQNNVYSANICENFIFEKYMRSLFVDIIYRQTHI